MKRLLKIMHTLGAIGLMGALAAYMVMLVAAPQNTLAELAAVRQGLAVVSEWLIMPSLLLVLVTGLLSMGVHPPFHNATWVWAKALFGIGLFEGTLGAVDATAQRAARLSAEALSGEDGAAVLESLRDSEWVGLWTIMGLSLASVVLGVWRPRVRRFEAR